jgi:hypothetical protein
MSRIVQRGAVRETNRVNKGGTGNKQYCGYHSGTGCQLGWL